MGSLVLSIRIVKQSRTSRFEDIITMIAFIIVRGGWEIGKLGMLFVGGLASLTNPTYNACRRTQTQTCAKTLKEWGTMGNDLNLKVEIPFSKCLNLPCSRTSADMADVGNSKNTSRNIHWMLSSAVKKHKSSIDHEKWVWGRLYASFWTFSRSLPFLEICQQLRSQLNSAPILRISSKT